MKVSSASVEAVLNQRARAVLAHDAAGLRATQAPGAAAGVRALGQRLAQLPLTAWRYQVAASVVGPGPGEQTVSVVLHYRLAGDAVDVTARRRMVVDSNNGGRLVSDDPDGAALPWDLGPVGWTAGAQSFVLSVSGPATADLVARSDAAASAVTSVWGTGWRTPPVIVAVPEPAGLAALTGRSAASVAGLVAVSTPDRVYVDMSAYDALDGAGRQVLLTHEVTHVATAAGADRASPQWLKEGFADYVGFLHSPIGVAQAAAQLLADVRSGGPPAAVPADSAFAAGASQQVLADAYAGAWLMCVLVAERAGQRALVAVYRATAAGTGTERADVDAALRQVTGVSLAGWTAAWRRDLVGLAA